MSKFEMEPNSRILIVDDNRAIHEDFKKILCGAGLVTKHLDDAEAALFGDEPVKEGPEARVFQLESAYQGEEGLEMVRKALAEGKPYAMAFMDVRMPPGMDGIETTAKIWTIDPDLQVVICTAYSDYSWAEMLQKLAQSDRLVILKKPFDNIEVQQLTNSLTRKWQLLQESKSKMADLEILVAARTSEMVQEQEKFRSIFDNSPDGILQTTREGRILSANPALAAMFGYSSTAEMVQKITNIGEQLYRNPEQRDELKRRLETETLVRDFEAEMKCRDGTLKWISLTASNVMRPDGSFLCFQGFAVDITAQKNARQERNLMEAHLRQAQKLESVGQLAAGIAHEINTPIQYIGDNIRFVEDSFKELGGVLKDYQDLGVEIRANGATPEALARVGTLSAATDITYLNEEIPKAIVQCLEGVERISKIVGAMKEFSHPGTADQAPIDLNHSIETALTVTRHEWKYVADVVTEFDAKLPLVPCFPHDFNQVIVNLVVNAAHAIGDVVKHVQAGRGVIKIATRRDGSWVEIRVSDSGTGIPENVRHRIFEPFFTTKEVGKGTGQGLAISHSTVVKKHGGTLGFETVMGQGTVFIIRLPLGGATSLARTGAGARELETAKAA